VKTGGSSVAAHFVSGAPGFAKNELATAWAHADSYKTL
jgi:hypothetical protein